MSTTAQEEWAGTRTYARRLVKGRAGVLLKVVSRGTPDTPNSAHGHRPTVRTVTNLRIHYKHVPYALAGRRATYSQLHLSHAGSVVEVEM